MPFRSGYIAILGKPNVGKSTLLNVILGQKVTIVSTKPNLTRRKVLGIKNLPEAQLIFVDTPGIHPARDPLNKFLVRQALDSRKEVDVILFLVEAHTSPTRGDEYALSVLKGASAPTILVLTKADLEKEDMTAEYQEMFPFVATVKISASIGLNIPLLLDLVVEQLPKGPPYYPEDMVTNELERDLASEIIREKLFDLMEEEVPYALAVEVEEFAPREDKDITFVSATIYVERESQKGIVIGKGGALLKKVGELARADIEEMIGGKVFLKLWVKTAKNWRKDPAALRRFGFA